MDKEISVFKRKRISVDGALVYVDASIGINERTSFHV